MSDTLAAFAKSRASIDELLTKKAWEDDGFRRRFVADPKGMMAEYFGQPMPDTLRVTVHEESAGDLHFVIPARPPADALGELTDAELEQVAGGTLAAVLVYAAASIVATAIGTAVAATVGGSAISIGVTASAIVTKESRRW
jgi:hypothetical protein